MPRSTNASESSASLSELRLRTAVEMTRLKVEADKYDELMKSATQMGDHVVVNTLTKMRLNATIEIARLKREIEKYQDQL